MCGIFFSAGFENLPAAVIDSVAHRGPDGRGWQEFASPQGPVVMAHRLLSIVDLSPDSLQPMSSEDKRFWLTFNGEIYNYREIRKDLEALGHVFRTKNDTEVLLKSYLQWGEGCLDHFNGMFAFVIWDDKEKKFFAARDRFGVKPLYYYRQGNKIAFASEMKQLLAIPGFERRLNPRVAYDFLSEGMSDFKVETFFQEIYQVKPGEMVHSTSNEITFKQWYVIGAASPRDIPKGFDAATQEFSELLSDSIRLRLCAEVPVGTTLSGGLDSSSILCLIAKDFATDDVTSYSACFPGFALDESRYIDEVSQKSGIRNSKTTFNIEDVMSIKDRAIYMHDEPFGSLSIFAQWFVCQEAYRKGVKVLLDGQGADEYLAGYHAMFVGKNIGLFKKWRFYALINNMFKMKKQYSHTIKKQIFDILHYAYPRVYYYLHRLFGKKVAPEWLNKDLVAGCDLGSPNLTSLSREAHIDSVSDLSIWYLRNALPKLLRHADRNSMAHSLESRLPFLDYRIVEKVLSYPDNYKISDALETKSILRNAMKNIVPDVVLSRQDKIGFAAPERMWMTGERGDFIASYLLENVGNFPTIFCEIEAKKHIKNKLSLGPEGYDASIWRMFCFISWMKIFDVQV